MAAEDIAREASAGIDAVEGVLPSQIPFSLVLRHERKTTKLLLNLSATKPVPGQNRRYDFEFSEPVFVTEIVIETTDYSNFADFYFSWTRFDGTQFTSRGNVRDNSVLCEVGMFIINVEFTPPKTFFTSPTIDGLKIIGFPASQTKRFLDFISDIDSIKDEAKEELDSQVADLNKKLAALQSLQTQRSTLNQEVTNLKSQISREQGKIKRLEIQNSELIAQVGDRERTLSQLAAEAKNEKQDLLRHSRIRSDLANSILAKKKLLSELQSNINLFPSELSSFSKQGSSDFRWFAALSIVPAAIILLMLGELTWGAADLTTKITGDGNLNIPALLVSRTPYVVISCAIITSFYYICKMLILEMIRISRQRLALTKISIIAKDISSSIDYDINLTEEEKYNKRLKLKMDMMRDHLKEYLSTDFKPTLPDNLFSSADIIAPKGNQEEESNPQTAS